VPASLTPESSGQVEVDGTWSSYEMLVVEAPDTVTLVSDGAVAQERVLTVTFDDIEQAGNDGEAIHLNETISVGAIENALFGKWEGKITYTVYMDEIVRMLDGDGQTVNTFAMHDVRFRSSAPMDELQNVQVNGETVDPENYTVSEGSTIITFRPDYVTSLPLGSNNIDINSNGGTASGNFTVTNEVPKDATIYEGATEVGDITSATEITPEQFLDRSPVYGDIFEYGDYIYGYNIDGWSVYAKDRTKTEYAPILSKIAGKPVNSMPGTFDGCTNMITAPVIPSSVTGLHETFVNCTSLTVAPELPDGLMDMHTTFSNCINLKTYAGAPEGTADGDFSGYVIPDSVTNLFGTFGSVPMVTAPTIPSNVDAITFAFYECKNLTGTVIINANPTTGAGGCFSGTVKPIVLTGSSTMLAEFAAPYGNVTVEGDTPAGGDTGDTPTGGDFNIPPFDPDKTEITLEEFGRDPVVGDTFEYGDYSYRYTNTDGDGWEVFVLDTTKTEYGIVLNSIGGKPIAHMSGTFSGCTNLTTAPVIPSGVQFMNFIFMDCANLTGTVTINASPDFALSCFEGTTKPIQLIGNGSNGTFLENLASQYNNVTVAQ
jgi:hypothetical protein